MDAFDKFMQEWGLLILILAIYSVMKHGKKNREKYKRWDRIRAARRKRRKIIGKKRKR